MRLRQKQSMFVTYVVLLIQYAHARGYELTFGDAHRSLEEATRLGFPESNHTRKLAIDLNLFKDGKYLSSTDAHRELGEFWESLSGNGIICVWGGRFNDGNHYSFKYGKFS